MSELGMHCMAGSGSMGCVCVCVGCDLIAMQYQEGLDAILCNLVVQPLLGLVCARDLGSDAEKPTESCLLACGFQRVCLCACMQHPCTFAPLPDTTQPHSSQGPGMKVVVLGQVSHQPLAACQSDEGGQSYTVLTTAVLCGAPTAISLSPLISLTCHQVQQGPHHPPCNDKSYRDLSPLLRKLQLNWITSKQLNGQLTSQTVISGVLLAYQPRLPRQACAPGAWGPGLAGLGATRSQVGHPCMGPG